MSDLGLPYIVMELLEGHDLADHLTSGGLPPREVVVIVTQLCRALARAHEVGIVHRDIKPSNVFLCQVGGGELFVKLLDFGVAKRRTDESGPGDQTRSGALLGSPVYMSPEQLLGDKGVDSRSDLWAVGVLTFEALTGGRPFSGETVGALTMQVHGAERPRPSQRNPMLPPAIDAWFARACAQDPAARFPGAKELADALAEALGERAPRGIALGESRPRVDLSALADTAEVPSSSSGDYARSASGAGSARRSDGPLATGAGIATSEPAKRESSWRPLVLVAVAALGVGIVGARWTGRSGPSTLASPPSLALPIATSDAEITPDAAPSLSSSALVIMAVQTPSAAPRTSAPKAKPRPTPSSGVDRAARGAAAPSGANAASSARTAPSAVRAQGSDDDIR